MSKMMQAAVVESLEKPLVLQEVPVPEPGEVKSSCASRRPASATPICMPPRETGQ